MIVDEVKKRELLKKLAELKEQFKDIDEFTDRHPYPSGMDKLTKVRKELEAIEQELTAVGVKID